MQRKRALSGCLCLRRSAKAGLQHYGERARLVFQNPVARAALIPRIAAVSLQCSDKIAVSGCKDFCLALNTSHAALADGWARPGGA